jgi:surface protein
MKKGTWKNWMLSILTGMTAVGFIMFSPRIIQAEESYVTLKNGSSFNAALKSLTASGNEKITAFVRTGIYNEKATTVSLSDDQKALAWLEDSTVYWYADADTVYMNADSSGMFAGLTDLTAMDSHGLNASKVTNMSHMFDGDTALASLDISTWNTASVKNMNSMFANMSALTSLNIDEMNTASVTDFAEMFAQDVSLTQLDLSSFAVSETSDITAMMKNTALSRIYISSQWNKDTSADARYQRVYPAYFEQTITMASDADMQDAVFTYTIAPGTPMARSSAGDEVKAGVLNETCMVKPISFSSTDSTSVGTPTDASANDKKYMQKTVKILIDPSQFTEPGIYRYTITESTVLEGVSANLFRLDENTQRTFDILVEYPENGILTASASVFHRNPVSMKGITLSSEEKNSGFTNSYLLTTNDLKISNDYEGNMSDTRRKFTYHVTIEDDIPGRVLKAVYSSGTVTDVNVDANGHAALDAVLTGSQCVTIKDIQKQASYSITSEKEELESFGFSLTLSSASPTVSVDREAGSMINPSVSEDVEVVFRNFRDGIVPTGIILDTAPYTVCMGLGAAGILLLRRKRKAHEMESE